MHVLLLPWLLLPALQQEASAPRVATRAHLVRLVDELARAGYELDADALTLETVSLEHARDELDAQQEVFFDDGHFHAQWLLYRAMGLPLAPDPRAFRTHVAGALGQGLVAYYAFDRAALVLIDNELAQLTDDDLILVHELAHAWQDREHDLGELYRATDSLEDLRILQCLVEGEAEVVAWRIRLAREGKSLAELDPDTIDETLARWSAGVGVATLYSAGRRFVLERVRAAGDDWPALAPSARPPSTEQILHASKLGRDLPVALTLPDWPADWGPAELVHEDTLGELGLFGLLFEGLQAQSRTEAEAWRAAIGWDGDRLRLWRTGAGEDFLAWLLVFDRDLDAEQFAATWSHFGLGRTAREGRAVAWALGDARRGAAFVERLLAHASLPPPHPGDAASTAELEAELPADEERAAPYVAGGRWHVPEHGFSLPLPAPGWRAQEIQGTPFLMSEPADGFGDNLNVSVVPNPDEADARALLEQNAAFFEATPAARLHTIDVREVAGVDVVYATYGMAMGGRNLEFRVLLLPRGDRQLVVTATLLASRAETTAPLADAALLGLRLER